MNPQKKAGGRIGILIAAAAILAGAAALVGLVYAALRDTTSPAVNRLDPVQVTCAVSESFDGSTKRDVKVQNTGDIPAYIRVKVVVNWTDVDGNVGYFTGSSDYGSTVTLASPLNWTNANGSSEITDGYWYYNGVVAPGDYTDVLIASVTEDLGAAVAADPQYRLKVTILAEALQASPESAVGQAWGMTYSGSSWSAYSAP